MPGRTGLGMNNTSMRISEGLEKPGTTKAWGAASIPNGWLELTGQVIAQAAWPNLFAIFGTTYNIGGEGAGNFRVPNAIGCTMVGAGTYADPTLGTVTRSIGAGFIGEASHALSIAELPSHNHSVYDAGHAHRESYSGGGGSSTGIGGSAGINGTSLDASGTVTNQVSANIQQSNVGSNATHNVMQPSFVQRWIVKG